MTPHHLPKKSSALKSTQISFLRAPQVRGLSKWQLRWGCRRLSFVLVLSDQMCTPILHGLAWYCCLFVYLWLMRYCIIFWCMVFCCLYCLLEYFPNYHSVCHPNKYVCTTCQQLVVVVTMDNWSSLDSGTQWQTLQLIT